MKNRKLKVATLAVASIFMMIATIAYYTDNVVVDKTVNTGNWDIVFTDEKPGEIGIMVPGDKVEQLYSIENLGDVDTEVRGRVFIETPTNAPIEFDELFRLEDTSGNPINEHNPFFIPEQQLLETEKIIGTFYLVLDDEATLDMSGMDVDIKIILEARQDAHADWESVATERITFGNQEISAVKPK